MNFQIAPKSTEIQTNWFDARFYCFSLNVNGKSGWRLPNIDELNEIYLSENDFEKRWYWSSTEDSGNDAWSQYMSNGSQYGGNKSFGGTYVRAIRSI
jgi:hypothetical protein